MQPGGNSLSTELIAQRVRMVGYQDQILKSPAMPHREFASGNEKSAVPLDCGSLLALLFRQPAAANRQTCRSKARSFELGRPQQAMDRKAAAVQTRCSR
jgi:hypothetical protein